MESTIKFEAEVVRRHSPEIAWPTIILALGLPTLWAISSWAALTGKAPLLAAMAVNTWVLFAYYTPLHDASHSAVVPRRRSLRWLNVFVGMISGFPIFMYHYHHRRSHMLHHIKTNEPEDPDIFAMGSFWEVSLIKTPRALINQLNPVKLYQGCASLKLTPLERRWTWIQYGLTVTLLIGLVAAGCGRELLLLWLIPWFVGELVMEVTFGWFPHHDSTETGRYRDTRTALFAGADMLFLFQNHHLIHHMLPAVPFYRYRAVFNELRPTLEAHGARIEGFWPYSKPTAS
jgi:beta-carotene hydroxylase